MVHSRPISSRLVHALSAMIVNTLTHWCRPCRSAPLHTSSPALHHRTPRQHLPLPPRPAAKHVYPPRPPLDRIAITPRIPPVQAGPGQPRPGQPSPVQLRGLCGHPPAFPSWREGNCPCSQTGGAHAAPTTARLWRAEMARVGPPQLRTLRGLPVQRGREGQVGRERGGGWRPCRRSPAGWCRRIHCW